MHDRGGIRGLFSWLVIIEYSGARLLLVNSSSRSYTKETTSIQIIMNDVVKRKIHIRYDNHHEFHIRQLIAPPPYREEEEPFIASTSCKSTGIIFNKVKSTRKT